METLKIKANGHMFELKPATQEVMHEALRNLQKEGLHITPSAVDLLAMLELDAEVARLCIEKWMSPDGKDPIQYLGAKEARKKIISFSKLPAFVRSQAEQFAERVDKDWKLDEGN